MARNALKPYSSGPPQSEMPAGEELTSELAGELRADNDELRDTNRQLIAAMEEIQTLNVTLQSVNEALHANNVELRSGLDQARGRIAELEQMLNGIGVAALLMSEALEVCHFNATAARFFSLTLHDAGRPLSRIRHDLGSVSLVHLCRSALHTGEPIESTATVAGGGTVVLRAREVDRGPDVGVLLTVAELAPFEGEQPPA